MADDWCEVMDMAKTGCAHCRPVAERRRLEATAQELKLSGGNTAPKRDVKAYAWTITVAKFSTRCGLDCGEPIKEGEDEIVKVAGYGWAHLECTQTS